MLEARIVVDPDFTVATVDPRLFGGFAEHMGRCVYGGIYDPQHPLADEHGFRRDVLELVRELDMPVMRYPGGNFVSGYRWEDGIGPPEQRPRRLDLAWKSLETNQFGVNEFVTWCRKAGAEPMLTVNLGTRGPEAARSLVEYCNHPGGTHWSDLRVQHGHRQPHGIRLWCLGNEMDGPWQMCHKTATEYGRVAAEAAKLMKWTDPSVELVACGSSGRGMDTFGAWEAEVLEHTFEHADYISIHTYYGKSSDDSQTYLAKPDEMHEFIREVVAACDYVAARRRSRKRIMLSFDEWNVWTHSDGGGETPDWSVAPPIAECAYTMADALVVGGMLIVLLNNCDRVKLACMAQVVNVIAPIMAPPEGPAWRQTIFHPFAQASASGRGVALQQAVRTPTYETAEREEVPVLTSACVRSHDGRQLTLFALNRSLADPLELTLAARGPALTEVTEWTTMHADDLNATNTAQEPEAVTPAPAEGARLEDGRLRVELPAASWNVIRIRC